MIYTTDAYGFWGKRHNFSCSLGIVKISIYLYHPGEKKPSLTIDEANNLFLKEINYSWKYGKWADIEELRRTLDFILWAW